MAVAANFTFDKPINDDKYTIRWQKRYFGEGGCRYAYAGRINKGNRKGTRIVVKKWKKHHVWEKNFWDKERATHAKAKELLDAWNDANIVNKKYVTKLPFLIQCAKSSAKRRDSCAVVGEWCLGEDYIGSDFEKWNSNSGYVSSSRASVQAFCHWTYDYSGGELLMCDAQGVRRDDAYYITDPCICSKEGEYGLTDCGEEAINSFFANHKCNEFCKSSWMKPTYIDYRNVLPKKKTSTYRWELMRKTRPPRRTARRLTVCHEANSFHKCDKCEYSTPDKKRFIKHKKIHSGEKPFECDLCHKRFRLRPYVLIHKQNVHKLHHKKWSKCKLK